MNERFKSFCANCQYIKLYFGEFSKKINRIEILAFDGKDNFWLKFTYRIYKRHHIKPYKQLFEWNLKPEYFEKIYFRFTSLNAKKNLQKQINKFLKYRINND